jgi:hypothetical protein
MQNLWNAGNRIGGIIMNLFDMNIEEIVDDKYTKKVNIPQYLPKNTKPSIMELCNDTKTNQLIQDIRQSNVTDEEKQFLINAAKRHLVFNYSKIADYYAHSNKEMQELMEKSALVIIDIDDAIANGYVKLSKNIEKIMNESGVKASEE